MSSFHVLVTCHPPLFFFTPLLYLALMLLGVLVVVDADEEDVACIVSHCLRVVACLNLADGSLAASHLIHVLSDIKTHHDV